MFFLKDKLKIKPICFGLLGVVFLGVAISPVHSQQQTSNFIYNETFANIEDIKQRLNDVILTNLIFCKKRKKPSEVVLARSCRTAKPNGCQDRISFFVDYIISAARKYDLSPWLLASVAYHESRFNPFVKGQAGELGIFQILPESKRGRKSIFINNERYRKRCKTKSGNCQEEIVDMAADHIKSAINKCNGNWIKALSMYNGGTCEPIRHKYVFKVKKIWKAFETGNRVKTIPWCDRVKP